MAALNAARAPLAPMVGEVLWLTTQLAFTLPGNYVYISRRLIERCTSDDPVAFVLAHEMAHHDLGHLDRAKKWLAARALAHAPGALVFVALEMWSRWLYSRENELAADAHAFDLCRNAGFDPAKGLECFDIMSWYLRDRNDFEGVYGLDEELELHPQQARGAAERSFIEARLWLAKRRRSHPSIHERKQLLLARLEDTPRYRSGHNTMRPACAQIWSSGQTGRRTLSKSSGV